MLYKIKSSENLQKIFVLIGLFAFPATLVFLMNELRDPADRFSLAFAQGNRSGSAVIHSSNSLNPQPYTSSTLPSQSQVLGRNTGGCEDQNPQGCKSDVIAFQPVCTEVNAGIDLTGGSAQQNGNSVTVRKNSVVEIWKVTSPLAILSGKEAITDSTFEITKTDPAFRSAGNLIDEDLVAAQFYAPGDDKKILDQTVKNSDRGAFSVHVSAGFSGSGGSNSADEATILDELDSLVSFEPSDPNPGETNNVAGMISQYYTSPGQPLTPRNYADPSNPTCQIIEPAEIDLPSSDVYETCVDKRSPFDGLVGAVLSLQQWTQCAAGDASCEEVELVGLLIDAPFGSNDVCNAGFCADQYFDTAVASGVAPTDASIISEAPIDGVTEARLKPHYVTTPCRVRVDYKDIYDIPCLWDISPYKAIYDLEASRVNPNDPDFPTWEEYWAKVEAESERRGSRCGF